MSRVGLKIGLVTTLLLLITVATMGAVSAQTVITRDLPDSVNPEETFNVTLTISGLGETGFIGFTEQVPSGFTIISVTSDHPNNFQYEIDQTNNSIMISATGDQVITYTLQAPAQTGTYSFEMSVVWGTATVSGDTSLVVGVPPTTTTPTPTPTGKEIGVDKVINDVNERISVKIYDIDEWYYDGEKYVAKFDIGDKIKLMLYNLDADETTTIEVRDWSTDDIKVSESFQAASKEITVDTSQLYPGYFYLKITTRKDGQDITINTKTGECKQGKVAIYIHTAKPEIHIDLLNKRVPIVKGDNIVAKVKVYNTPLDIPVYVKIEGPMEGTYSTSYTLTEREKTLIIPTAVLFDDPYDGEKGTYKLTVEAYGEKESVVFDIVGIEITFDMPTEVALGNSVKVKGTTNIAESGSVEDDESGASPTNYVLVEIFAPDGTKIAERICDVNSDGTWENASSVKFLTTLDTGSYKVVATAYTAYMPNKGKYIKDDNTIYLSVVEPSVEFTLDKFTFARGESIKFKGKASVEEGTKIVIASKNLDRLVEEAVYGPVNGKYYVETEVDANGKFYKKLHVAPDAPKMSYTIEAIIVKDDGTWSSWKDTVTIRVAKAVLNASISRTEMPRGASFTVSGTTTLDYVYIYTDDKDVIKNVGKIPSDSEKFTDTGQAYRIKVTNDQFNVKLTVEDDVDTGSYLLYVIAPANPPEVDPTEDAMAIFSIQITEFGFTYIPDKVEVVRGDEIDVIVGVNGDPDDVIVKGEIVGHGVKVKKDKMVFSKLNETESGGYLYYTIMPFYDDDEDRLKDTGTPSELLPVGVYSLTLHLYIGATGEEVVETTLPMEVVAPVLNVEVPEEVKVGNNLVVSIDTNRGEKGYDYIYVVLDLGADKIKINRVALDENGDATVDIPTAGITPGTYKLYVRDTMRTEKKGAKIDDYYDISPTDAYAKNFSAEDDLLWTGEVKIVEAIVTTPTPTTPTPTTPPPTTPPPTTPTPTTPPPTTPTPTTPPPTTPTPSPGFEAVFAIAGLIAIAYLLRRRQ